LSDGDQQVVDPIVSRAKFDRELGQYRAREDTYRQRGWWLMRAEYPRVLVAFISMKTKPRAIEFGALLDFTNYDLRPPSVRIVDPFTEIPYAKKELPTMMPRRATPETAHALFQIGNQVVPVSFLIQAWDNGGVPFVCLPGVREYHDNPGHSGDSWFLHRNGGEGTLYYILEKLWQYGSDACETFQVNMIPQIGFSSNLPA
jgi:putative metal binding uncharacterized protein